MTSNLAFGFLATHSDRMENLRDAVFRWLRAHPYFEESVLGAVEGAGFPVRHTALVSPNGAGVVVVREPVYTGISARQRFTLLTPTSQSFEDGISRQTKRISGLRDFIDELA